jgi:DNA-binding response OmpR family regulator
MNENIIKPKKIMVVDDDRNVLFLISEMLERENYQVIQASDGLQAMSEIGKLKPDLAILDVMIPGMDGFEVCRRIKSNPYTNNIKVIMVTARTTGKDIETGMTAGADYYITKPFRILELSAKIKELLT